MLKIQRKTGKSTHIGGDAQGKAGVNVKNGKVTTQKKGNLRGTGLSNIFKKNNNKNVNGKKNTNNNSNKGIKQNNVNKGNKQITVNKGIKQNNVNKGNKQINVKKGNIRKQNNHITFKGRVKTNNGGVKKNFRSRC
jgi:hypothetical protein